MNILQMLPKLESGGVETGTVDLVKALTERGHKSVVISSGGKLVKKIEDLGGKHYVLDVHKKSLISILKLIPKVRAIIKNENIDILHARSRVPAWIGFFAARNTRAVFITTCHGYYNTHPFSYCMGWGKIVIVISQIIGRHMFDGFKVPRERIRLIYRGVDLKDFLFRGFFVNKNNKKKVIGIVGRITPIKGHNYFIKALPGVFSEFPQAKAVIIGTAAADKLGYLKELIELVNKLNLKDKVEFAGESKNIPQVLKELDVLVLATTTQEAFGRVIIEAGAVGVPVVATRVGGVVEILEHERNSLLVEPANPYDLSCAINRVLNDEKFAEKISSCLKDKVAREFSLETMVDKTVSVYKEVLLKKRILVIKLGALGDLVLITPALKALRNKYPDAVIDVLVKDEYKDFLQTSKIIDDLIIIKSKGLFEFIKTAVMLRKKEYDFAVDFQNNRFSHLLAFAAGIRQRFGYKNKKLGFLLNCGIPDKTTEVDPVTHQFMILRGLGIDLKDRKLEFWLSRRDEEFAEDFFAKNWINKGQLVIGINPVASLRWQTKMWQPERYIRLADILAQKLNARILFTGAPSDVEYVKNISSRTHCKAINSCGETTISQLAALIKASSVFITTDSAPLHIAAAVGTPLVALFGPTDPNRHMPYSENYVLLKKNIICSPCYRTKCLKKTCMNQISVEEVAEAVITLINNKNNK